MARLSLLSTSLAAMLALSGCVSTTVTTPEGLTVERVAVWSDFTIKATRKADGSISVEETQTGDQAALLEMLRAAGR